MRILRIAATFVFGLGVGCLASYGIGTYLAAYLQARALR